METSFFVWIFVIGTVAAFGLGTMIQAYSGSGSLAVVFNKPCCADTARVAPPFHIQVAHNYKGRTKRIIQYWQEMY